MGLVERLLETQLTPSVKADCSTVNFMMLPNLVKGSLYSQIYIYKGSRSSQRLYVWRKEKSPVQSGVWRGKNCG